MNGWRAGFIAAMAACAFAIGSPAAADEIFPFQNTASETYYHLNTEAGTIDVRVEMQAQASGADIEEVWLWLMPGATGIKVQQDGQDLEFEQLTEQAEELTLGVAAVKLLEPLKGKLTAELQLTYSVPNQATEGFQLQPGAIEAHFISQGNGSFVLIDVPQSGENFVDSGCVLAHSQPSAVRDAGYERWVCGEPAIVAISADNPGVLERCAKLNDYCRQKIHDLPTSAWAQSITDPGLQGVLREQVMMAGGPVELELKYFKAESAWAQKQFDIAKQALPRLEALFGFPYPFEQLTMRQSHQIGMFGAAGIAFPTEGQVLLATGTGIDNEVTIHEVAHQWAGSNLEEKWLWEGLAEWATTALAPGLGVSVYDEQWESYGYTDPLSTWLNGSLVIDSNYWYGKGEAFWFAYEEAIGGREAMTSVLARLDDDPGILPVDSKWFMDRGEEVSVANLDALFLEWVWVPLRATAELEARREAHTLVDGLRERAAAYGLTGLPTDLQANLDAWSFRSIEGKVEDADELLLEYADVVALEDEAGLTRSTAVAGAWGTSPLSKIESVIRHQRQVIQEIAAAAETTADEPAGSEPQQLMTAARAAYARGELDEAASLASDAGAVVFNAKASVQMIAIAEAEQERYQENFLKKLGLMFEDPQGDLDAAHAALEAGETESAVELARSAFDAWNGAQARGLQRLAMAAGLLSVVMFGGYFLLRRLDSRDEERPLLRDRVSGHVLPEPSERSWRDWENTK